MKKDVECPYCGAELNINHDDGQGYEEDEFHHQECQNCGKTFVFTTSISFSYEVQKADCLNGGRHKWKPTHTYPTIATRMECQDCGEQRKPTQAEWVIIKEKAGD